MSRLGLGTGSLGGLTEPIGEDRFRATVGRALARGTTYFDTAPLYGLGRSEERLGKQLAQIPRESFTISTKIGRLLRSEAALPPGAEIDTSYEGVWHDAPPMKLLVDFGYDATLTCIEESLARLHLDHVDIVYIHDTFTEDQYTAAMNGAYRALDQLRSEGVIGAVGVGIGVTEKLIRYARDGDFDCFLVAGRYTLLDHAALPDLLPLCVERHIAVVIGGVFNSGILTDPYAATPLFNYQRAPESWLARARQIDTVCRRHHVPLKAAALQFPLAHPAVACILSGAATPEEVDDNVDMLHTPIPSDLWADLRAEGLLPDAAPIP